MLPQVERATVMEHSLLQSPRIALESKSLGSARMSRECCFSKPWVSRSVASLQPSADAAPSCSGRQLTPSSTRSIICKTASQRTGGAVFQMLAAGALLMSPLEAQADFSPMIASESVNATIEAVSGLSIVLAEQNSEVERNTRHEASTSFPVAIRPLTCLELFHLP